MQNLLAMYSVQLVRDRNIDFKHYGTVDNSTTAARIITEILGVCDKEHFIVVMLDARNKIIGVHTVSIGSLTATIVHPREVFKAAILSNAASVILAHNHPSGDTMPSPDDIKITNQLVEAGKVIDIGILDHIIVDTETGRFTSMLQKGLIQ